MTRVSSSPPPHFPSADSGAPPHVPLANDGGIEGIVLQLEDQSRRSRALRNDARDVRREQQAVGIRQARKSARLALAGSLVQQVGQAAASIAQSAGRGADSASTTNASTNAQGCVQVDKAPGELCELGPDIAITGEATGRGSGAGKAQNGVTTSSGAAWSQAAGSAAELSGTLLNHFATRATSRAEVAQHASELYGDVAADAEEAAKDAGRMAERALQHLDAILSARREAEAAILRG